MIRPIIAACILATFMMPEASAQKWSDKEMDVWKTIQKQWNAVKDKKYDQAMELLHPSHLGWEDKDPMPRDRAATDRWLRYGGVDTTFKLLELNPVGFAIVGDSAVAHYYYSIATEDNDDKRKTVHGRYTDVLVKTDEGWRFIAWHGGDDPRFKEE